MGSGGHHEEAPASTTAAADDVAAAVVSTGAAGSRSLSELDKTEPILRENMDRFCMFP